VRSIVGEIVNESTDLTLIDMEASIEHMSRGTVRHIDKLLVVVEPYYRALETAGRIVPLARGLGINNIYAIANKLRGARDEEIVTTYCRNHELEPIAMIPFDESVVEADRLGRAVIDYDVSAPIVEELLRVVEFFQREA
jgi:CO dehydrogenase maturation factor